MTERKEERPSKLEKATLKANNVIYYNALGNLFYKIKTSARNLDEDYQSGAKITYVSPSQLPDGVLGFYSPSTHTITMSNNLSSYEHQFVKAHESAHALGIINEDLADAYANSQVGYHLRAFGHKPLPRP
jgi:hypothetical protein